MQDKKTVIHDLNYWMYELASLHEQLDMYPEQSVGRLVIHDSIKRIERIIDTRYGGNYERTTTTTNT